MQFRMYKIKHRCGEEAVQFSESPWGDSQAEDGGVGEEAFHSLKILKSHYLEI